MKPKYKSDITIEFLKSLRETETVSAEATTPSMEPLIKVGETLLIKKVKFNKLKEEDIIAFTKPNYRLPVVHRIKKKLIRNNKIVFITKGDNAPHEDKFSVEEGECIGKVLAKKNTQGREIQLTGVKGKFFFYKLRIILKIKKLIQVLSKNLL